MGCNVLLHVALLWGLPPAYITVFGQKPCQQDQRQVECLANDTSPENTCPGVGVYCTSGDKLCGCVGSRYRNNRFKCVKYGDCVERKYDTMALLQAKEAVYLVGVSKHPPHSELPYKCMKLFLNTQLPMKVIVECYLNIVEIMKRKPTKSMKTCTTTVYGSAKNFHSPSGWKKEITRTFDISLADQDHHKRGQAPLT
uniref:Putative lipocalin n=1 Tax=Rhipicephalus microplus TaxID=6941 RepID=A0A6G5A4W3_RHIMP